MLREWGVVELLKRQLRKNKSPSFLAVMKLVFKIQRSLSSFTPHWPFYPTTNTPQFPRPKKKNVRECQWSFKKKQTKASSRTSIPPKKKNIYWCLFILLPFFFGEQNVGQKLSPGSCRESCHVSCNESSSWKMMDERGLVSCWVETWYLFHVFRTETTGTLKWKSITASITAYDISDI